MAAVIHTFALYIFKSLSRDLGASVLVCLARVAPKRRFWPNYCHDCLFWRNYVEIPLGLFPVGVVSKDIAARLFEWLARNPVRCDAKANWVRALVKIRDIPEQKNSSARPARDI